MAEIEVRKYQVPSPRQLKAARVYLGLSQDDFAKLAGLGKSTITDYEQERREVAKPSLEAIVTTLHKQEGVTFKGSSLVLPE